MSNKSQILCVKTNKRTTKMLQYTWKRINRDYKALGFFKNNRQDLIIQVLTKKQNKEHIPEGFYIRLSSISKIIEYMQESINSEKEEIKEYSRSLIIF